MKIVLSLFMVVTLSLSTVAGDWQKMMSDPDVRYQEIKQAFDGYWAKRPTEGRRPGHKQFKRWQHFVEQRLSENGTFNHTQELWQAWLESEARRKHLKRAEFSGNWLALGPHGGPNGKDIGRVNGVFSDPTDPQTLYLCTPAAGIWKTTNAGRLWVPITAGMPTFGSNGLVVDPRDTEVLHAITGDPNSTHTKSVGVLKSVDGGATWQRTEIDGVTMMYDIEMHRDNPDILWIATNRGLYQTTDAGANWSGLFLSSRENPFFRDIAVKPNDANILYGMTGNGAFYRSTDGGRAWSLVEDFAGGRSHITVSPADPNRVYATVSNGNSFKGFYRSDDAGVSFSLLADKPNLFARYNGGTDGQAWYDQALTVDPENPDLIYVGGIKIWQSEDGGYTWNYLGSSESGKRYVHDDVHYLGFHHGTLYVGCDGGVYRSDDNAESFQHLNASLNIMQFYRLGLSQQNADHFLGGSQDNGTSLHSAAGWRKIYGADGMECAVDPAIDTTVYYGTQNGPIYRRDLAGGSSRVITPRDDSGSSARGGWVTPYVLDPSQPGVIYAGYTEVYKSTDRGDNWQKISDFRTGYLGYVVISPADNQVLYAGNSGADQFYRSVDGGANWSTVRFAPAGDTRYSVQNLLADHADPRKLWIVVRPSPSTTDGRVFRSDDAGATWTNITGTLPRVNANCLVQDRGGNDRVYVGTDLGVFYREPGFSDWISFNEGMPPVIINEMEIQYATKRLRAATFSRGMWESELFSASREAPLAGFTATETPSCDGVVVQFRDTSTGSPTSRNWTFPGGNPATSTEEMPVVTYNQSGVFDVTLRVTNEFGSDEVVAADRIGVTGAAVTGSFADDFNGLTEGDGGIQLGQWINLRNDKANWLAAASVSNDGNGNFTGPESDASGDGMFLYLPDAPASGGIDALLLSPCIDLSPLAHPRLTFQHYTRGAITTEISVDVFVDGEWFRRVGTPAQGSWNMDRWRKHIIDLTEFSGKQIRLLLRGSASISNNNRCAIDDVRVVDDNSPFAPEVVRVNIPAQVEVDTNFSASVEATDPNGLDMTYRWYLRPDYYLNGQNIDHAYDKAGEYVIRLVVTNTIGAETEQLITVSAVGEPNQTPVITSVTVNPQRPTINQTVTLSATATDADGDTLVYTWRSGFGPGRGREGQTVEYSFYESGRQSVWLDVNDGRLRGYASQQVFVDVVDTDGSERMWHSETREGIDLQAGETRLFKVNPTPNWTELAAMTRNGSGDVDLYLKEGSAPTLTDYDQRSNGSGTDERIVVSPPQQQTYYMLLHAKSDVSAFDFALEAQLADYINPGQTRDRLDVARGAYRYFYLDTRDYSDIVIETNRGEGDLDLYVGDGYPPTTNRNDWKAETSSGFETINISNAAGKRLLIGLYGYEDVTAMSLRVSGTRTENRNPVIGEWRVPSTAKVGETITFTASASDPDNDNLTFRWTTGDGRTLTGSSVSVAYDEVAEYEVSLEVLDGRGGRDSRNATVTVSETVNHEPTISSLVVPRSGVADEAVYMTVNASDEDGDVLTFAWDFGDGNSGEGSRVTHRYAQAGTYYVVVTVTDGRGGRAEERGTVNITPAANREPVITALTVPEQGYVGEAVAMSVTAEDADGDTLAYTWSMGDGTSLEGVAVNHVYQAAGTYTVSVAVSDDKGASVEQEAVIQVTENQGIPTVAINSTLFGLAENTGGEIMMRIDVPADQATLRLVTMGGSGDSDMYVKIGDTPTTNDYQYYSWSQGNRELIDLNGVAGQTVYVLLHAYSGFDGLMFAASSDTTYTVRQAGAVSELIGSRRAARYFRIVVPANAATLRISASGGSGDCDLYLAEGREPTLQNYDAVSANGGNNDALVVEQAAGKTYTLMQYGYSAYSGLTLEITFE